MTGQLGAVQRLKLDLMDRGLMIAPSAATMLDAVLEGRAMTPADYASTSGIIVCLGGEEWVNAPISAYNPNFVVGSPYELAEEGGRLIIRGPEVEVAASFWVPPAYHDTNNSLGEARNSYCYTHGDRTRVSPIEGCSMACTFCNLPYEYRYRTKRIDGIIEALRVALDDPIQPGHHVLISGGTPRSADVAYVREVYERVIAEAGVPVDIMMVPRDDLMDPIWLRDVGVNEVSVNLEIFNEELGTSVMRQKAKQGRDTYLNYLEHAARILGGHRVRSMLLVGIESMEDTLDGVRAISERGATVVLSPFRPDPMTPLRDRTPPSADFLEAVYLAARDIVTSTGGQLGPSCIPCTHNTLTFAGDGGATHAFGTPYTVG